MSGSSGWQLSPQLEALVKERQWEPSSLKMVALYRQDTWDHQAIYHIARMSVVHQVPMEVVTGQSTQKLTLLPSPLDMALQLEELLSTAHTAPVQVVLSPSSMLVLCE
jgi:hypothetical protein